MFELGLGSVLVQFASHEMGKLELIDGKIQGDKIEITPVIKETARTISTISPQIMFIKSFGP